MPKLHIELSCKKCGEFYVTNEQNIATATKYGVAGMCKKCKYLHTKAENKKRSAKYREIRNGYIPVALKPEREYVGLSFKEEYNKRTGRTLRITK